MRLRPLLLLAVLAALAGALGACGNKTTQYGFEGEGQEALAEGMYSEVGGLKYQVQISRELNPTDAEDRAYLIGLPPTARDLKPDETWFAVFLRVQYDTKDGAPRPTARDFTLEDTQRDVYRPVPLAPDNVFAYRPTTLLPTEILPGGDTPAAEGTIQGSLLLFRVKDADLQNRPLTFKITNPENTQQVATQDLDV
jgi:hypothetical protein